MSVKFSLGASVLSSFQGLQTAADTLNKVSDEMGKSISRIDDSLKRLNLGIVVWIKVTGWDNTDQGGDEFWAEEIGYSKVNGKWGICLRRREGCYTHIDEESTETWLFNDAPRSQRLEALDKIPDLLKKLSEDAAKMTHKMQERLADTKTVADAIAPAYFAARPLTQTGGAQ